MYKKKEFDKRYLIIIFVFVIALLLVIVSVALKKDRNLNPVEKALKDSGTFIVNVVSSPVNLVKNLVKDSREKKDLYKKYKKLKEKEEQIDSIIAEIDNLKDERDKLKKELELNAVLSDKVYKNATIINRNIDYWYDEITIDKGSKDGIKKNMAVVNYDGLIGTISKVSNHVSTVKLLANENMSDKISVKIKVNNGYVYGLISKYESKKNSYTVEGISENVEISEGAEVVTTGMGDIYTSGLFIGTVSKVTTDNFDLSKVAVVKASVDFNNLDYVTILKRKDS
ncbi:MAG: rod shape-determining protein MreC [Bacilli bacterium]|nr:rod shape-determining protein MreC [Bacilli bacterium]